MTDRAFDGLALGFLVESRRVASVEIEPVDAGRSRRSIGTSLEIRAYRREGSARCRAEGA